MAPTRKEAQCAELHKTIWRIANDLLGSMGGWDFKRTSSASAVLPTESIRKTPFVRVARASSSWLLMRTDWLREHFGAVLGLDEVRLPHPARDAFEQSFAEQMALLVYAPRG